MGERKRLSIWFDMDLIDQRQAYELLKAKAEQTGHSYGKVITDAMLQNKDCSTACVARILKGVEDLLNRSNTGNQPNGATLAPKKDPEIDIDWSFVGS